MDCTPLNISVVSYLNSKPFLYGLERYNAGEESNTSFHLSIDTPAVCAQKLLSNEVDIGLVPVAILPSMKEYYIISDFCIGAVDRVGSVMLYGDVPLQDIKTVLLDYQSRTSVTLVKVLAKFLWKIDPEWKNAETGFEKEINGTTAGVIIGDRTFGQEKSHKYIYDLSHEWNILTGLPFVFACWAANKKIPDPVLSDFNDHLKYGIESRDILVKELQQENNYSIDINDYLFEKIKYDLDEKKRKALKLFLEYIKKI